jgi:hypothetical protein
LHCLLIKTQMIGFIQHPSNYWILWFLCCEHRAAKSDMRGQAYAHPKHIVKGGLTQINQHKTWDKSGETAPDVLFNQGPCLIPNIFCRLDVRQLKDDQSYAGIKACCDVNEEPPVGLLEGNLDLHNYDLIPHPVTSKRSLLKCKLHDFMPQRVQLCDSCCLLYVALTSVMIALLNGVTRPNPCTQGTVS